MVDDVSTVSIDGKNYTLDALSDQAKIQLAGLQRADQKLAQLQQDLAIIQTARMAHARALAEALPKETN